MPESADKFQKMLNF